MPTEKPSPDRGASGLSPMEEQKRRLEWIRKRNEALSDPKVFESMSEEERARLKEYLQKLFPSRPRGQDA